jgi:D-arabinose 1-dehydrogenase-like Zn-dependent alcohol dehydrogenase
MINLTFHAREYRADDGFDAVEMNYRGSTEAGFVVSRAGAEWLRVGPGYRVLKTVAAGVCSTDLDRRFLPFPLPQITGHEVLAEELGGGVRYAIEINASRFARGSHDACAACRPPLERHCPHRLVLGIHDLPGGFGPYVLAPVDALVEIPAELELETAVLMEPLAAAFRAAETVGLQAGDRVAVIGPRRLGMLVIAALASRRRTEGLDIAITALARREALRPTALAMGADDFALTNGPDVTHLTRSFDVVIDTTASPEGFLQACEFVRRELHLKSTHGQPCGGLSQTTAMVVDEVSLRPWSQEVELPKPSPQESDCFVGASSLVVESLAAVDHALRPSSDSERGLVRPLGTIFLRPNGDGAPIARLLDRGVTLSTSRCGDFRSTLARLTGDGELRRIGRAMITDRFNQGELGAAFEKARGHDCLKALVTPISSALS